MECIGSGENTIDTYDIGVVDGVVVGDLNGSRGRLLVTFLVYYLREFVEPQVFSGHTTGTTQRTRRRVRLKSRLVIVAVASRAQRFDRQIIRFGRFLHDFDGKL